MHVPSPKAPGGAKNDGTARTVALRLKPTSRRQRLLVAGAAMVAVAGTTVATLANAAETTATPTTPTTYSIWPSSTTPKNPSENDTQSVEVGTRFTTQTSGWVTGVRYYKSAQNTGTKVGKLWDSSGKLLGKVTFTGETGSGWQEATFDTPVTLKAGSNYVVSYRAPNGHYANDEYALSASRPKVSNALSATQGVYTYASGMPKQSWHDSNYYVDVVFTTVRPGTRPWGTTTTATPTTSTTTAPAPTTSTTTTTAPATTTAAPTTSTTTAPAPTTSMTTTTAPAPTTSTTSAPATSAWPDASNTGVPSGTSLSTYSGPCTITTANTVIDAKTVNCDVIIKASGVKISRSHINGRIGSTSGGSVTISDTYIDGGKQETFPAVGQQNITLQRVNVVGGQHSVQCYSNCRIEDSYLHAQTQPADVGHVNAFISNGGSGFYLKHNTLHCTVTPTGKGGGCTADASLFGDFGQVNNATFENNLFRANSSGAGFCTQAGYNPGKNYPNSTNIVYRGNVFERGSNGKCGIYGPVTAFNPSASGNVWSGNVWTDGASVNP